MTFPTLEDFTESSETSSTTSHTADLPATVNVGDRLWLWAAGGDDDLAPSGGSMDDWSSVFDQDIFSNFNWQLWTIYVDNGTLATELALGTATFSTVSSTTSSFQVARFSGAAPGGDGVGWDNVVDTSTSFSDAPNPPSVSATAGSADNAFLAYFTAGATGGVVTANPASYTAGADGDAAAQYWLGTAYRLLAAASDNPASFTIDDGTAGENWRAGTLVMAPAPAGVEVTPARAELTLTADTPTAVVTLQTERAELTLAARTPAVVANVGPAPLAFADGGYTQPRIEAALNYESASSLTDLIWTDLSDRLQSASNDLQLNINRGRADEAAETEPSQLSVLLDNTDGALTPGSAASPWWPAIDVGLPIRYWEDGPTPALILPGSAGATCYSDDHPDFDIAGDIDVRVRIEPNAWSIGVVRANGGILLANNQMLVSKWGGAGDRSWWLALIDAGWPFTRWSADGTTEAEADFGLPSLVAATRPIWFGWTFDVDDGAGNNVHTWWRYDGDTPPDDITTWTEVATSTTAGTATVHSGGGRLELGSWENGTQATFAGRYLAMQLRDGTNGTLVADADFTALEPGTTSFEDGAGKTWQLAGAAQISRRRLRFCGEATEIDTSWPYGDNEPLAALDDDRPSESRVAITASGVLRRLTTGQDPLQSSLTRAIVNEADNVTAYWPCEDGRQAARIGAGLDSGEAMVISGLDMAADSTLPAAAALPTVPADETASWAGPVTGGPSTAWSVEMVLFIETPTSTLPDTEFLSITASGSIARWTIAINDTVLTVTTYDAFGAVIDTNATAVISAMFGQWLLFRFDVAQDGGDVDWQWRTNFIDTGTSAVLSDTISSETCGAVTGIDTSTVGPPDGMSFGHIMVHDGLLPNGWLSGADTAWVGESAAHRFWRLCVEEGVPVEIIGDPNASAGTRGDLGASQAMGPQGLKTLPELLSECVAIDMGVLIENNGIPGLIFRTRSTLEDQAVQIALDAATNDIAGLAPTRDNQTLVNELKVTSTSGASALIVDTDSKNRRGRYSDSVEINGVGGLAIQDAILLAQDGLAAAVDAQNLQQASWRLTLGTAPGMRYPTLTIDLGTAPHLIEAWLTTTLGDRFTVTNLPVQHPTDAVELLLQHAAETTTPTAWILELTFAPGEEWLTGELVE